MVELSFWRFDTGTVDSFLESAGAAGGWLFNKETCCTCCGSELLACCCLLKVLGPIPVDLPLLDATGLNLSTNPEMSDGRLLGQNFKIYLCWGNTLFSISVSFSDSESELTFSAHFRSIMGPSLLSSSLVSGSLGVLGWLRSFLPEELFLLSFEHHFHSGCALKWASFTWRHKKIRRILKDALRMIYLGGKFMVLHFFFGSQSVPPFSQNFAHCSVILVWMPLVH